MHWMLRSIVVLIGGALVACHAPRPIPGSTSVAAWQKQFAALDCWNPRHLYDMPSTEPVLFAMVRICNRVPIKREKQGWETVVTIDARTDEVRALPITSIYTGGVHFTAAGDVVWYSSGKSGEAAKTQNYAEAYVLRKGEMQERLLGRIDLPFVLGPGVGFIKGDGCHLVSFANFRQDDSSPRLRQSFLVKDDEPFASAKALDDLGRGLYWDPVRRYFVAQKESHRTRGYPPSDPLSRYAIDCSGAAVTLDADLIRRLEPIKDENAIYVISRKGDLIVESQRGDSLARDITVFFGDKIDRISAPESYADCPDLVCEPFYIPISPRQWSRSGEYFMVDEGYQRVHVYRAADMQIVKQWDMAGANDFPAHGFINDNVAYQFNDHSRVTFQTW
jgi:hypothetical protein